MQRVVREDLAARGLPSRPDRLHADRPHLASGARRNAGNFDHALGATRCRQILMTFVLHRGRFDALLRQVSAFSHVAHALKFSQVSVALATAPYPMSPRPSSSMATHTHMIAPSSAPGAATPLNIRHARAAPASATAHAAPPARRAPRRDAPGPAAITGSPSSRSRRTRPPRPTARARRRRRRRAPRPLSSPGTPAPPASTAPARAPS